MKSVLVKQCICEITITSRKEVLQDYIQDRSPLNVKPVTRILLPRRNCVYMEGTTPEKSHINAKQACNISHWRKCLLDLSGQT